jgi:hypothetical protein
LTAADIGRRHAQRALVETQEERQRLEQVMRLLRRGPHRHRLLAVAPLRHNTAALDRMAAAAMLP